ncbi:hypothetical protein RHGRI_018437 [Rhododendron griersonianum]|uniref:DYW domain-containing protein n=1 Tax=Rhododendron griersonianum TaxID=479676 RepID=A0AAV6K1E4_9ERIC|nr:hypothetical protein RHGRI_018437 [Rhododendron griersonianum]
MASSVQQLLPATPTSVVPPKSTHHTTLFGLGSCSTMGELKQYHSQIIRFGLSHENDAMGRVIKFCAISKSGDLRYALRVFHMMPHPDAFIYNVIIRGHLQHQLTRDCILFYLQMLRESVTPNRFTFPSVISACCVDYAVEEGRWEDVATVRKLMNDRGVKKAPGFSRIELEGVVNEFIAGGRAHPQAQEIYAKLDEVLEHVRKVGYVSTTDGVVHDIEEEEEEREKLLYYHSEKLAIALGLLKTKHGETLHITKNLRVCKDCHTVSKLISKIYDREIIVRDRSRFHHFRGGDCSCNDYCRESLLWMAVIYCRVHMHLRSRGRCLKILQIPMSEVTDKMVEKHAESLTDISVSDIGYSLEITSKGLKSLAKRYESLSHLERKMPLNGRGLHQVQLQ